MSSLDQNAQISFLICSSLLPTQFDLELDDFTHKIYFSQVPCYLRTHPNISKKILEFQYKYPSLASVQITLNFKEKTEISLSFFVPVLQSQQCKCSFCVLVLLVLNSLEGVAWSSWSQAINFLLTNPTLKKFSYLEFLGVLVHESKVSKSLFNYALVLFNSSTFYFKFFICF